MDTSAPLPPVPPSPNCNPAPRTIQIEFPQHSSMLLEALNRHRLEGKFCDVSLLVQGRELRAHKAVLAAASPYFHDKLLLGDAPRLTLPSVIEADAFEGLLQLIYSGRLRLPLDALPAHLLVASGLQMWQVVDQCSEILRELETSGGGMPARGATPYHTLLSTASSTGGWCIRSSSFQAPVQASASTQNPVGGEGSELGEVLQIQVEEEEEEEEDDDEDQGSAALSQTPQPARVSGVPHSHGSHPLPKSATPRRLPEEESAPLEPPAPPAAPPKIFYIKQEPFEPKEDITGSGTQSGGVTEETTVFPKGGTEGSEELGFLPPSGVGATSGGGGPSWKPVDLHRRRRWAHPGPPGAGESLVLPPPASGTGESGREGIASRTSSTRGSARHVTSAEVAPPPRRMSFLLDPSFLSVGMWSIGAGALGAAALALLLANTDIFLSKPQQATLKYLEEIDLKTLEKEPRTFKAKELWEEKGAVIMAVRRPGCFLCREEAADLSSLKPKLDELGVPLYAVVKEQVRTEVKDFQPYFKGEIFLDEKKKFYGPQRRKMMFMGFLRLGVWSNFFRARSGGFSGNLEGEGFILGGVFVVGSGKQGILLEHREKEFGDKVNLVSVLEAAKKIKPQTSAQG